MNMRKSLFFVLIAFVSIAALSCSFNETAELTFSVENFSRAAMDLSEKSVTIRVYDNGSKKIIQELSSVPVSNNSCTVTMSGLPVACEMYVYALASATSNIPVTADGINVVAWSGKSDAFSLSAGEQKYVPVNLTLCPLKSFHGVNLPSLDTLASVTSVQNLDGTNVTVWYVILTVDSRDGRPVKKEVVATHGLLYAYNNADGYIEVKKYIDANLDVTATIECYSVNAEQLTLFLEPGDKTAVIQEVLSCGPKYSGSATFSSGTISSYGETSVVNVPLAPIP